ncbi:hypothetical protein DV736_g563, partial [Chaetothyriales sp. CBS 134916]
MSAFDSSPRLLPVNKTQMSITLPRNFAPMSVGLGSDPKTPDQTFAELNLPPPPQHNTLHTRRPRINFANFQARNAALPPTLFASEILPPSRANHAPPVYSLSSHPASDEPLPSIELAQNFSRPLFHQSVTEPSPCDRLRLPAYRGQVPRTPPAQTKDSPLEVKTSVWEMRRSGSECSSHSDSSASSPGTFATRPTSFDGSVTSPEIDGADPFSFQKVNIIPDTPTRRSKKIRVNAVLSKDKVQWSIEMDNHLFNVYQMYLADPSVTPFKTVPGSIPPTGVCHRVARRAKETWPRASRIRRPIVKRYKLRNVFEERSIPREKTPEPNDFLKTDYRDSKDAWPSEAATRRRLKQLCKEKFTISAHYQRLRQSRSPSPFTEQFVKRPASRLAQRMPNPLSEETPAATIYATRELGISLVASGATAPLVQLVAGDSHLTEQHSDDFFNTPLTSDVDAMRTSPPSGLGISAEPERLSVAASSIPRLASPFTYSTWNGPSRSTNKHRRYISQNQFDTIHATGSRLLSPFRPEPDVSSNVNKRRAQHNLEDELSPQGSNLVGPSELQAPALPTQEFVLTGDGDLSQRRIRLRSRGATMGAVNNRERIQGLFNPPDIQTPTSSVTGGIPPFPPLPSSLTALSAATATSTSASSLAPPELDPSHKRLGSPFELDPNKRSLRAHTPRHVPSLSDPSIGCNVSQMSIEQRLEEFTNLHKQRNDDPFA